MSLRSLLDRIPPTVHPMLVHFPIALLFTAALFDAVGVVGRKESISTVGFILETLGLVSVALAIAAGTVAEHAVSLSGPGVRELLRAHKRDATLTALIFGAVWLLRLFQAWRRRRLDGVGASYLHLAGIVLGLALLTATSSLGGSLVYDHGVGVAPVATVPSAAVAAQSPTRAMR